MEFRLRIPFYRALVLASLGFLVIQCDNPGSVGGGISPRGSVLTTDTIPVPEVRVVPLKAYSGNTRYASVGVYDDALFGRTEAVTLLHPTMPTRQDTIYNGARIYLRFVVLGATGDTARATRYEIVEVTRRWRAPNWTIDSTAAINPAPIGSFIHTNEDTITVDLASTWTDRYSQIFGIGGNESDSIYQASMHGLAVRAVDEGKILHLDVRNTSLVIDNPDAGMKDLSMFMRQTAMSVVQGAAPALPDSVSILDNSFRNTAYLVFPDPGLGPNIIGSSRLSRLMLQVAADTTRMKATLPPGHARYGGSMLSMYLVPAAEADFAIIQSASLAATLSRGAYQFNLTGLYLSAVNAGRPLNRIYLLPDLFDGTIRHTAVINHNSSENKPRLVINRFENP